MHSFCHIVPTKKCRIRAISKADAVLGNVWLYFFSLHYVFSYTCNVRARCVCIAWTVLVFRWFFIFSLQCISMLLCAKRAYSKFRVYFIYIVVRHSFLQAKCNCICGNNANQYQRFIFLMLLSLLFILVCNKIFYMPDRRFGAVPFDSMKFCRQWQWREWDRKWPKPFKLL